MNLSALKTPKGCLGCLGILLITIVVAVAGLLLGGIVNRAYQLPVISLAAEEIPLPFSVPLLGHSIPNTLPATWLSMLVLILVAYFGTRKMELVPSGFQNAVEAIVEMFYNFVEGVAGEKARTFFPLVATFFFFILISNWMGILPGFGSIGVWVEHDHHVVLVPFLRSANAHLSTTIALAIVSVGATQYFGFKMLGRSFLSRYFTFKSSPREDSEAGGFAALIGKLGGFMERIGNAFAGLLELVSEFIKILSFSFRLFGNIFAGEVLLIVVAYLAAFLASLPFMGLEIFVGFVQALIFSMLSLVFFMIATAHHGSGESH